ncbi:hypothetical protein T492DRAFT_834178 [Pavlovales sp. CCMP2436]|nr:hypothetical protein T492DRAFT_834178 [Pavlovales sp. CCMP2436]
MRISNSASRTLGIGAAPAFSAAQKSVEAGQVSRSAQDEHLGGLIARLARSCRSVCEQSEERARRAERPFGCGLEAAQGGQVVVEVERAAPGERAQAQLADMAHGGRVLLLRSPVPLRLGDQRAVDAHDSDARALGQVGGQAHLPAVQVPEAMISCSSCESAICPGRSRLAPSCVRTCGSSKSARCTVRTPSLRTTSGGKPASAALEAR